MYTIINKGGKYYAQYHKTDDILQISAFVLFLKKNKTAMVCNDIESGAFDMCLPIEDIITEN